MILIYFPCKWNAIVSSSSRRIRRVPGAGQIAAASATGNRGQHPFVSCAMSAIFSEPVRIEVGGSVRTISSLYGAEQMMVDITWPVHGPRYDEALTAIASAIDGERSTADAEQAFRAAAVEAGLLRG